MDEETRHLLLAVGGLVTLLGIVVRAYITMQRRQVARDEQREMYDRKTLDAFEKIAAPLEKVPSVLEEQRRQLAELSETVRVTRQEQQVGFRGLALEIQEMGRGARAATAELIQEIRRWRPGNHQG